MKIAIIRLSSLGDIITTLVFLEILHQKLKNITKSLHITWIVDSSFSEILEDSPLIDEIVSIPLRKSKKNKKLLFNIAKQIKSLDKFDKVLDFQGLIKSLIIGKMLKKDELIGFEEPREKIVKYFYTKKAKIAYKEHILKRNWELLKTAFDFKEDFNLSLLKNRAKGIGSKKDILNINFKHKNMLFILEASKKEKEYPLILFLELALMLKDIGISKIYLIWDKKEKEIKELAIKDSIFYLMPKLNLTEIKSLLLNIDCVVGGDTGITHLAWALGVKSITLYGNTPIDRFKLEGENHISICQIRQERIMKNNFSIKEIPPKLIYKNIKILMNMD
ncbi:lipopolysaccharide heptosyltransferase I [Helicobacter sp. MIT 14-3879]|uniref:lipopolysaccharide heptosyltransferase I n=1 Tax=Helicobacter sp. MIT 14-3879 TaxID=2040649 RepID=UPI000E1F625E|nr:lipopolysaccharide heptosyltransferase I [Helicobacter sp. MIT 14-3879]RDU62631.1 lipopolysaccharide heptosyltransferase I [Helicobacter sp. MIT 14-3879]